MSVSISKPKLRIDDLRGLSQDELAQRLVDALGTQQDSVKGALGGKLLVGENLCARVKRIQVNVPAVAWREVGATGNPAFENSWVNFNSALLDTAAFRINDEGRVDLKGTMKSGTLGTACFTLPSGYRPSNGKVYMTFSNSVSGYVAVGTTGAVTLGTGSVGSTVSFSIDGVFFYATSPAAPDAFTGVEWPLQVDSGLPVSVQGVTAWQAVDLSDSRKVMHGTPGVSWEPVAGRPGRLSIRGFSGLSPGRKYLVTLVFWGG